MIKKVIAGFLTFGFAFNVCADVNVESIRYEDSAVVGQTTLQLNGAGLRKKVGCRTTPMRQPAKKSHRNLPSSSKR